MKKYGVEFPLLEKGDVNGDESHPLYKYLRENSSLNGDKIPWNFAKFLCNGDGEVVKYYDPETEPNAIEADIEALCFPEKKDE